MNCPSGLRPLGFARLARARRATPLWLVVASLAIGCGGAEEAATPDGRLPIKRLAIFYGRFVGESGGRAPRDEAEFRQFVEKQLPTDAESRTKLGDPFVSPRDGKPFAVPMGTAAAKARSSGLAAYEQEGVDGRRLVAFTMGDVEEVDDARLQDLLDGKR